MPKLHRPNALEVIDIARRFDLDPTAMKAKAFAHFTMGFSLQETMLLMKQDLKRSSLRTYYSQWCWEVATKE